MTHPRFVLSYKFLEFDYCDKRLKLVLGMDHYIFHMKLGKSKKIMGGYLVQQIVAKPARHLVMQIFLCLSSV